MKRSEVYRRIAELLDKDSWPSGVRTIEYGLLVLSKGCDGPDSRTHLQQLRDLKPYVNAQPESRGVYRFTNEDHTASTLSNQPALVMMALLMSEIERRKGR